MLIRFCLYSVFKNLRPFEAFFILFLLSPAENGGADLSLFQIGLLVGFQKLVTGLLEIPSGFLTDAWGRRRATAGCFVFYTTAFPIFALSSHLAGVGQLTALYFGQLMFGLGEAFRTGSHKAIMLDWVDQTNAPCFRATRVLGFTRFFSKATAGISALLGAVILMATGDFSWLFWAASLPAAAGIILLLGYPRWLEGEQHRKRNQAIRPTWRQQFHNLWAMPGMLFLMLQSILFESQIKSAQHYIQPFFEQWLGVHAQSVMGPWVLAIGGYYLLHDLLGAMASVLALPAEKRATAARLNQLLFVLGIGVMLLITYALFKKWLAAVLIGFVLLAALQNMRRPIFLARFNDVMDKPQRTTTLSIESQARTWIVAIVAPITGYVADHQGLPWALVIIAGIFSSGLFLHLMPNSLTVTGDER